MRVPLPVSLSIAVVLSLLPGCGGGSPDEAAGTSAPSPSTTVAPTLATTTTTLATSSSAATSTTSTTGAGGGTGADGQAGGDTPGCSAEGSSPQVGSTPGVPDAVQRTRQAIVDAAIACDYAALAELAATGDSSFTYSFGGGADPAEHWRRLEDEGAEDRPLRYLVELLRAPHGVREVEGRTVYAWPSAFTYDEWDEVPEADRAALRPLYGDEDFASFEQFGGYVGYRIGIAEDGEWLYFVAGD